MKSVKAQAGPLEKKNSTIYSHKLHYRYRWKIPMILIQCLIILICLFLAEKYLYVTNQTILQSLGYVVILWLLQGSSFFLYCFVSSHSMRWHIDAFLSPWGGWRTKLPLSISDYQQIEGIFFVFGTSAGFFVTAWWGLPYGALMLVFHLTLSIPRLFTVVRLQKWKKAGYGYVVKHERQGIGLYSITG